MTQAQQAGANALGGYIVGRMEGRSGNGSGNSSGGIGRVPSKRALSRLLEYQKGAYGAHLEYLGQYNLMHRGNMALEHQLGEKAAEADALRQSEADNRAHLNELERVRANANANRSQMRAAAKIAPGLQEAGVNSFEHTPEGGVSVTFHPPAKKAPAKKAPAKPKPPANPKP